MFTPDERGALDRIFHLGFIDVFREFCKAPSQYTWWPYRNNCRQRNIGWRIDYFLASKILKDRIRNCCILKEVMGSDHCPICLEVK